MMKVCPVCGRKLTHDANCSECRGRVRYLIINGRRRRVCVECNEKAGNPA